MNKLLIIGASGHGRVVADIAYQMKNWNEIKFLDDDDSIKSTLGIDVIDKSNNAHLYIKDYDLFVAIGNNRIREKIQNELEQNGASIPSLIHPNAIIGQQVVIGMGTAIMAGAIINCCSNIGKGCIINTAVTIDHDNIIGEYVHLSPGVHLAGTVNIGNSSWLGIGSIVGNNINITNECVVGAGAVVVKDIIEKGTYIGVPARKKS